jgi:uncharacterized membrane protein YgcG
MTVTGSRPARRRLFGALASAFLVLTGPLLAAGPAEAATVSIHDDSHVLDATRIQNEAATLPDPVAIYTTTKYADDKAAFDREAQAKATAPTGIVIAINTQSHHLAIRSGAKSRVNQQAAAAATQAFIDAYRGTPDYTAATVASLASMRTAIAANTPAQAAPARRSASHSSRGVSIGGLLCLVVVVGAVIALLLRRRRGPRQGPGMVAGYDAVGGYQQPNYGPDPGYGPGYAPGYQPGYQPGYGPGYAPGYGPGYGQPGRSGVSPWVAGGVGAAAGGLLGYELARNEDREEEREFEERQYEERAEAANDDNGYSGGGGADGDFGGDASGGDASGGGDNNGGGDF